MPGPTEIFGFLHGQLQTPPIPTTSFAGRTVIITGGNSGLGLEAAKQMFGVFVILLTLNGHKLTEAFAASISTSRTSSSAAGTQQKAKRPGRQS